METTAAAALVIISFLLQIIRTSGSTAATEGRWLTRQLQVLSEVVSGPARGRPLVLHLDVALATDMQRMILGLEAVRNTPHFTLCFGRNHSHGRWPRQETAEAALPRSSSSMLHVVLYLMPRPELLQELWFRWEPRNLLLFSLGSFLGADVLLDDWLSDVEKLALIGQLSGGADRDSDTMAVYTVLPFSSRGVQFLGLWKRQSFSSWGTLFPDRFPSFQGYTFHIASRVADEPFFYSNAKNTLKGDGVCKEMLQSLSTKLNFAYTTTIDSPDSKWGALSNGSWDGLLGMIQRREKNFSINMLYNNYDRGKAFDMSVSFHTDGFGAFLPSPAPLPLWSSLVRPLRSFVWFAVLLSLLASIFITKLQENVLISHGYIHKRRGMAGKWLELYRGLVSQSAPVLPRPLWQRVFLAVWLLCCLVITAAYTCNLVGIFTRPAYPLRLRSLQDLINSDFRIAVPDSGNVMIQTLMNSQDPLYVNLREKTDIYPSVEECLEAMVRDSRAILETIPYVKLIIGPALKGHGWYIVGQKVVPSSASWFFRKRTAWKYKFDEGIQQLLDAGLVHHWMQIKNAELTGDAGDGNGRRGFGRKGPALPLTLQHLQGLFYILSLAWVAGGAVLMMELLVQRYTHSRTARAYTPSM